MRTEQNRGWVHLSRVCSGRCLCTDVIAPTVARPPAGTHRVRDPQHHIAATRSGVCSSPPWKLWEFGFPTSSLHKREARAARPPRSRTGRSCDTAESRCAGRLATPSTPSPRRSRSHPVLARVHAIVPLTLESDEARWRAPALTTPRAHTLRAPLSARGYLASLLNNWTAFCADVQSIDSSSLEFTGRSHILQVSPP